MNPFKLVTNSLDQSKVKYIAVGGFAAVLHGSNRFTGDIDKFKEAMSRINFTPRLPVKIEDLSKQNIRVLKTIKQES